MEKQLQQNLIAELRESLAAGSNTAHASSVKVQDLGSFGCEWPDYQFAAPGYAARGT